MDIKTNKIDSANAEITGTILNSEVETHIEKIAKHLAKTTSVAGFRKGKVPVSAVKKQYGEKLVQDAEGEALRDFLGKGLNEMSIANDSLIGEPQVTKFEKGDESIAVEIKVAIRPEVELGDYAALVPDFKKPRIMSKDIDARIEDLAASNAGVVDVEEDRALVDGDTAVINFEGSVDGVVFDGGTAENFALVLGSGQFIPGFEEQVVGMKKDEDKVVKVTFPENYGGEELAGKDAEFKVKVNGIQVKAEVVVDDELAQKMLPGEEGADLKMLQEKVKEQILNEKLSKLYQDELKPSLLDALVTNTELSLPAFVVEQEMDMALNKKAGEMEEAELNELKENAQKVQELRESLRDDAVRSVKATFIVDALAKKEDIKVEEQEVMQTIYYEAMQTGQDPQAAYKHYQESGYLPAVQMAMVEDKVLSKLLNTKIEK
ncbi:MAG: trigger factor [Campylobacterota bacterium]|nr:trigger factor [Campylobacterota bacterium]